MPQFQGSRTTNVKRVSTRLGFVTDAHTAMRALRVNDISLSRFCCAMPKASLVGGGLCAAVLDQSSHIKRCPLSSSLKNPSLQTELRVLVDFDGTIVPGDVTDHVLQSFAGPQWLELEAEWQAGRMNSRDCLGAQVDLIRASRADIYRAVNERSIDPDFPAFLDKCRRRNIGVTVVSDGFDLAIEAILERYQLNLPYFANHLKWLGDNRWRLEFPHRNPDCRTAAGNCKCRQLAQAPYRTVVIGDGRSDFCAASHADFVLSKASLTKHCQDNGLRHLPIKGFADVVAAFDDWVFEAKKSVLATERNSSVQPKFFVPVSAASTTVPKEQPHARQSAHSG